MKTFFLVIFLFLSFSASAQKDEADTIHWRSDYKLKAEDFKGVPDIQSRFGAVSEIELTYRPYFASDTTIGFRVKCVFNRSTSWVNPHSLDSNLLEHEQGHFNLAEVYKRMLSKQLKTLEKINYKNNRLIIEQKAKAIFDKVIQEMNLIDEQYDNATAFPPNRLEQNKWNKKIAEMFIPLS